MFRIGSRFARLSFVGIVATAFLGGAAMTSASAQATKLSDLSKADQVALKAAINSCKSEARRKKIKLRDRRQYVVGCVTALKDRSRVDVEALLKKHPNMKGLPCPPNPDPAYKLAC
jgi:hypothetical protein